MPAADFLMVSVNNALNAIWIFCLVQEPRFSRRTMALAAAGHFIIDEVLSYADLRLGAPLSFYAFHYCFSLAFGLGICILMSSARPAKVAFLFTLQVNFWTFVIFLRPLLVKSAMAWNVSRILLHVAVLFLFMRYLKGYYRRISADVESGYGLILSISFCVFLALSLMTFYNLPSSDYDDKAVEVTAMVIILMMVLFVDFLLFRAIAYLQQRQRLVHMDFQKKILLSRIEAYEQMEEEARRRRHDERHHNRAVMELARREGGQAVVDYLSKYEAQAERENAEGTPWAGRKPAPRVCEHRMVNSIIGAYSRRARQEGVTLTAEVVMGTRTQVTDMDLVVILGNILENAIRACREAGEPGPGGRDVHLRVERRGRKLVITCTNPCNREKVALKNGLPLRTGRKAAGGIGVTSILHAAKKYGGDVEFSMFEGRFMCCVLLNDPLAQR